MSEWNQEQTVPNYSCTCQYAPWHSYTPEWVWAPDKTAACATVQKLSTAAGPDLPEAHTANWQRQGQGEDRRIVALYCTSIFQLRLHLKSEIRIIQKYFRWCKHTECVVIHTWHPWMSLPLRWEDSPSTAQTASGAFWGLYLPVGWKPLPSDQLLYMNKLSLSTYVLLHLCVLFLNMQSYLMIVESSKFFFWKWVLFHICRKWSITMYLWLSKVCEPLFSQSDRTWKRSNDICIC